mmetsp:Transcript_18648/g.55281  ORF Transcript_18648/g.55281 Transcript_18648/m.55281 type:complete len:396 (+) Transcript_18648:1125-2312(+)
MCGLLASRFFFLVGGDQAFHGHNPNLKGILRREFGPRGWKRRACIEHPSLSIFQYFMSGELKGFEEGMYPNDPATNTPVVERDGGAAGPCGLHNPEGGIPINRNLWRLFSKLDPDAAGRLSPELKDLLNRIFDPDHEKRIEIEDILVHPWLQSHQAATLKCADSAIETAAQRSAYYSEMANRFIDPTYTGFSNFKLKNEHPTELLPPLSRQDMHAAVKQYAERNSAKAALETKATSMLRAFKTFVTSDDIVVDVNAACSPSSPNDGTPLAHAIKSSPLSSLDEDSLTSPQSDVAPVAADALESSLSEDVDIFRSSAAAQAKSDGGILGSMGQVFETPPHIFRVSHTQRGIVLVWVRRRDGEPGASATYGEWCSFTEEMKDIVDKIISDNKKGGGD